MVPRQRGLVALKKGIAKVTRAAVVTSVRKYAPLVRNFAGRELKSRYKRSLLGWTWSLLSPLSTLLVYSLVFSVFFRASPPAAGDGSRNFALFLFSGLVAWLFFSGLVTGSMGWLTAISDLRKKVYFPPEAAVLGSAAALGVQSLIEMGVLISVMVVIGNFGLPTLLFPVLLFFTGLFGLGIGFVLCVANSKFRDVQYLATIVINAVFFLVPIVYPLNMIPERHWKIPIRALVDANPINQFVAACRESAYLTQWPSLWRWAAVIGYSLASFGAGWWFFRRHSMKISEEL